MKTKITRILSKHSFQVFFLLLFLEIVTYGHYFVGLTAVNGDINGHYFTDSYFWWNNGGLFDPPEWVPYTWMGRPGGVNLQDGSYVLPQGIANLISPWTPGVAAILSALTTAFGAWGMYLLMRRLGKSQGIALIALVAQFYAPQVFSNAQFLDFHRGATYIPWVLLICSPLWYWEKRWGIPLASLILWQVFVGVYPGMLIGSGLAILAWSIAWAVLQKERAWVLRWSISVVFGLVLSIAKVAPALLQGTGVRDITPQRISTTLANLGTFFFPYDNSALTSDISMRSFFVVMPVLFGLLFLSRKMENLVPPLSMLGVSAALLMGSIFFESFLMKIPGINLSRFIANDYKLAFVESVIILGVFGLEGLVSGVYSDKSIRIRSFIFGLSILGSALTLNLPSSVMRKVIFVVPILVFVALLFVVARYKSPRSKNFLVGLLIVSLVSGMYGAYSVTSTWASSKSQVQTAIFGQPLKQVMAQGHPCVGTSERRGSRVIVSGDLAHDTLGLIGAITCVESTAGYANIQGSPVLVDQMAQMTGENSQDWIKLYSAPGSIVPLYDNFPRGISDICLNEGHCSSLEFKSTEYKQRGSFSYDVVSRKEQLVVLNESYYKGWSAQLCDVSGQNCRAVEASSGAGHLIQISLPEGEYKLKLEYHQPHRTFLILTFWIVILLVPLTFFIPVLNRKDG